MRNLCPVIVDQWIADNLSGFAINVDIVVLRLGCCIGQVGANPLCYDEAYALSQT